MGRRKGILSPLKEGEKLNSRGHKINIKKTFEYNKKWGKEHPKRHKKYISQYLIYALKKYGVTPEDYNLMFIKQKGCCAICGKHQNELKRKLSIDHNHSTGVIRGLLCNNCNLMLGFSKENIDVLQKSIIYLDKNNSKLC